jgi:hypothetical protein
LANDSLFIEKMRNSFKSEEAKTIAKAHAFAKGKSLSESASFFSGRIASQPRSRSIYYYCSIASSSPTSGRAGLEAIKAAFGESINSVLREIRSIASSDSSCSPSVKMNRL